MIDHKRCPTGHISQQQKQSLKKTVQNANTSHAAVACRLRAARRAECASEDAPGARHTTRRLRAGRRAACASPNAPLSRRKTRRFARRITRCSRARRRAVCALEDAPSARRKTRRLRAGRRAVCAPGDAPVARRVRARARPFFFRGSGRSLEVVGRRSRRVADGAASPGRLGRGASPSPLAATGSSTQHLSQSRGALKLPRSRASCSLASVGTRDVSGVRRKQKEERQPNTTRV